MMKLGAILAELREDRSLKQADIAEMLHLSVSSISAYETGSRLPNLEVLMEYARLFDVTADYLLGLSAEPISPSVFNEEFAENISMGQLVKDLRILTSEQRAAILVLLKNMRFYAEVSRQAEINGEKRK